MNENVIPEQQTVEVISDVDQIVENNVEQPAVDVKEEAVNFADKTLAELSELFEKLKSDEDAMSRSKEAEAIKSAFYKLLIKLKGETPAEEPAPGRPGPFEQVEENFKAMYADYRQQKAIFNRKLEAEKAENLEKKKQLIEELKQLIDKQDEVNEAFPAFRQIQQRWRETGPVPASDFRELNDNYHHFVEMFYDMVKINSDLRDLDFKKNLEAKTGFCEAAEKLAESENIVSAFNELQKLHEQWKELGPVAKEYREDIWNRFKAATSVINKRYQAHFEEMKNAQVENLAKKTALCEKVEEIAAKSQGEEELKSGEWNSLTKEIESLQAEWRKIGFATKKENQKIYERFRAACDSFFTSKRDFYSKYKDEMSENLEKKMQIIEIAEQLKDSKEWKKATDQFISLQKQWKEIGAVPRKKSEQLWKRFRAACDEFFEAREKEAVKQPKGAPRGRGPQKTRSVKDTLVQKYNALQQDIVTYENNIGFFSSSKNSEPLIAQMRERIEQAKKELKELEDRIRKAEEAASE